MKGIVVTAANPILINDAHTAVKNIENFQDEAQKLLHRLSQFRAWYAIKRPDGEWIFAPSKFIGYVDLAANTYSQFEAQMNGRDTEALLQNWFEEEPDNTPTGRELHAKLAQFLGKFGKKKNSKTRISLIATEPESSDENHLELKVVELIDGISKLLSPSARAELRKRMR
ncbi:hypothetical protein C8J30_12414 [Rhodobacter viridis]|uniref:Uncharacterized protein n=1 Tax=Rhodobacter viridis TaxID=1054202 RepID=A0A318TPF2_9RHOB|nr:hypothetical protein [Rhodobacter viridis]PYF06732.1 hypothetical protein C8J30_12414 [Rhodobacter viridis]